jgi:TonB family protein
MVKLVVPPFLTVPFLPIKAASLESSKLINPGVATATHIPTTSPPIHLDSMAILFLAWVVFFILFTLWPVIASLRMKRQLASAQPVAGQRTNGIPLFKSDRINVPMTFGVIRERIYVPMIWDQWSAETRRMILDHEIAHVLRRDGLIRVFQILVQAAYFFHPLVWFLSSKIDEFREMACDDLSTAKEKSLSVEYSRALVQIAENLMQPAVDCPSASALIRRKHEILNRVRYQMEDTMKILSKKRKMFILGGLILLIMPLSWAVARSAGEANTPSGQNKTESMLTPIASPSDSAKFVAQKFDESPRPIGGMSAVSHGPIYPDAAMKAGAEGKVILILNIDENGDLVQKMIWKSSGRTDLDEAAAQSIDKSVKWKPAMKDGKPVNAWVAMPFNFTLSEEQAKEIMQNKSDKK